MRAGASTLIVASALGVALLIGGALGYQALSGVPLSSRLPSATAGPLPDSSIASADGSSAVPAAKSANASAGVEIEVPLLVGKSVKIAEALVTAAGLTVQTRVADPLVAGTEPDTVVAQYPAALALLPAGAEVIVTYQPRGGTPAQAQYVVAIEAGHQQKPNLELEPVGPGSKRLKEKVAAGVTGVASGQPEYAQALAISLKLRDALVAKGIKVVMVRTANNVDIPNSERARIANRAKADLVVRVHLNADVDAGVHGIGAAYPSGNAWVEPIEARSRSAALKVLASVTAATKAPSRGAAPRSDMAGFNYSTRPSILVECGFVSNPDEDRLVTTAAYQQRLADGMAAGILAYLQGR